MESWYLITGCATLFIYFLEGQVGLAQALSLEVDILS